MKTRGGAWLIVRAIAPPSGNRAHAIRAADNHVCFLLLPFQIRGNTRQKARGRRSADTNERECIGHSTIRTPYGAVISAFRSVFSCRTERVLLTCSHLKQWKSHQSSPERHGSRAQRIYSRPTQQLFQPNRLPGRLASSQSPQLPRSGSRPLEEITM
jgi:hypothetical protein